MRRTVSFIVVITLIVGVLGWFYIAKPELAKRRGTSYIAGELAVPSSAHFRFVKIHGDSVCGEVRGIGLPGGNTGYKPFWADSDGNNGQIEPDTDFRSLDYAQHTYREIAVNTFRFLYGTHCVD